MTEMLERCLVRLDELLEKYEEFERYQYRIAERCQNGGRDDMDFRSCKEAVEAFLPLTKEEVQDLNEHMRRMIEERTKAAC